jgi:hypothetical protein
MLGAGEHVLVADGSAFACWSSFSVSPFRLRFIRASVFAPCASLSRYGLCVFLYRVCSRLALAHCCLIGLISGFLSFRTKTSVPILAALRALLNRHLLGRLGCKGASARAVSFSRSVGGR